MWSLVVPTGLYITRGVGAGVQTALRRPTPEQLATDVLDVEGALASAACALRFFPVSPTADHLRNLVSVAKVNLEELVAEAEQRRDRSGFLRLFRDPDFRDTNRLLRAGVETLKSRVHLYLLVVNLFPEMFPKEDNGAFSRTVTEQEEHEPPTNELKYYGAEYAGMETAAGACSDAGDDAQEENNEALIQRWAEMVATVQGLGSFIGTPSNAASKED